MYGRIGGVGLGLGSSEIVRRDLALCLKTVCSKELPNLFCPHQACLTFSGLGWLEAKAPWCAPPNSFGLRRHASVPSLPPPLTSTALTATLAWSP